MLQGKPIEGANTCAPLASASKEELAGVEDAIRINIWRDMVFRIEDVLPESIPVPMRILQTICFRN